MLDVIKEAIVMLDSDEKIELYGFLRKSLKDDGAIKTYNVVGDFGERKTLDFYSKSPLLPNLQAVGVGTKYVDAINANNERYSIKATTNKRTSVFNGLNDPDSELPQEKKFEYVIIVMLNEDMSLKAMYELNWEGFLLLKKWNTSKRTWYLTVTKELERKAKVLYQTESNFSI
ncbi:hypothetical protein LAV79_22750 [Peribacillus butanolivorans]|uniref:hypothetical protein n=1 Tax=Peribacillus butanolivorans TaxID=421767 RepID=UPI0030C9422C